ncbi:alpha/beta fold hydrolase [Methyloligella sp. 2.7D]|uniref:alpha/beta fold hydrolase n=1 Tax=unclassified Methyloligella TaxID=2625955 RepID=UPI00157C8A24|nr:alpha/beta fold hydrolase [Methyloligella sp. GL2]QKP76103.1 alpha/beta fold hydrolase [Methyloligella sp. GL2]
MFAFTIRPGRSAVQAGLVLAVFLTLFFAQPAAALYDVPSGEIPGKPGSIIRVWPLQGGGPTGAGGKAFRILYRSKGLRGEPIAVSGAIFIPGGAAPQGGWPIIAYAHPTSGVVPPCAPSLRPDTAGLIWGLKQMLNAGFIVVATDYPGLGTSGPHPYLYGDSEARAVLDSVRAARAMEKSASNRFVAWGHSQGGQAVLFTGQIARSYAPELKLLGVAAAAPATYLIDLFDDDIHDLGGKALTAMALYSWSKVNGISAKSVVKSQVYPAFERTAQQCLESIAQVETLSKDAQPLKKEFLTIDPAKTNPWRRIMMENTPGKQRIPVPVFLAQGTADKTVNPALTKKYGAMLCRQGTRVQFVAMPGVSHTYAARNSVSTALKWMQDRFRGAPAPSSCGG